MKELSKNLMCISIKGNIEIWIEEERINGLITKLNDKPGFIEIDGQIVNSYDIIGVFDASTMYDAQQRRKGSWMCGKGNWHLRNETCECNRPLGR